MESLYNLEKKLFDIKYSILTEKDENLFKEKLNLFLTNSIENYLYNYIQLYKSFFGLNENILEGYKSDNKLYNKCFLNTFDILYEKFSIKYPIYSGRYFIINKYFYLRYKKLIYCKQDNDILIIKLLPKYELNLQFIKKYFNINIDNINIESDNINILTYIEHIIKKINYDIDYIIFKDVLIFNIENKNKINNILNIISKNFEYKILDDIEYDFIKFSKNEVDVNYNKLKEYIKNIKIDVNFNNKILNILKNFVGVIDYFDDNFLLDISDNRYQINFDNVKKMFIFNDINIENMTYLSVYDYPKLLFNIMKGNILPVILGIREKQNKLCYLCKNIITDNDLYYNNFILNTSYILNNNIIYKLSHRNCLKI